MENRKFCVYTALFGNYEELNNQDVAKESNIDFICFTDDKDLYSETWNIVRIDPIFPLDPVRSARYFKITPHRHLPQYDTSLYIDNSVTLKVTPEEIFRDMLSNNFNLYCIKHSFRETVLDEYEEVLRLNYDKINVIVKQFNTYSLIDPSLFSQKPYWSGFMIRNHNNKQIINTMEDWLAQVFHFSRRDQLSLNYAIRKNEIDVKEFDLDNSESKYHKWPTSHRYKSNTYNNSLSSSLESNMLIENIKENFEELEIELSNKKQYIQALNAQLAERNREVLFYKLSKSWRFTRPFRKAMKVIRGKKND